ncbi:hypothetical protein DYB37_006239 [Aphanomyces astaci]|uniref:Uncharacterized protein n=1 Tax=Aphanomyces astaci TaxID=112090 RepID=A0A418DHA6_APHAT|nr:hypothetical protein DYB35_008507 [Aphanomyces astaci]RHZ12268.1 hypothetical protein DYB37_006239 [Aphanomyces astaci]
MLELQAVSLPRRTTSQNQPDTGPLKHPDQFRAEMNEARRQALNTSSTFATPSPDPLRHLAFDSEPCFPKRASKSNPRYASMLLAEVALDAELEGYQYDYDSFMEKIR